MNTSLDLLMLFFTRNAKRLLGKQPDHETSLRKQSFAIQQVPRDSRYRPSPVLCHVIADCYFALGNNIVRVGVKGVKRVERTRRANISNTGAMHIVSPFAHPIYLLNQVHYSVEGGNHALSRSVNTGPTPRSNTTVFPFPSAVPTFSLKSSTLPPST